MTMQTVEAATFSGRYPTSKIEFDHTQLFPATKSITRVQKNKVLFWQGEANTNQIEVVEGVVRAVHLLPNGERMVLGFFWPGDVILSFGQQPQFYTAEAVTNCRLALRPYEESTAIGASSQIMDQMLELLQGVNRRTALSRLAWTLLRMRDHVPWADRASGTYWFMIPRRDIADYLGLSLETVSRGLTELRNGRAIDMPSRATIRFHSIPKLMAIAEV